MGLSIFKEFAFITGLVLGLVAISAAQEVIEDGQLSVQLLTISSDDVTKKEVLITTIGGKERSDLWDEIYTSLRSTLSHLADDEFREVIDKMGSEASSQFTLHGVPHYLLIPLPPIPATRIAKPFFGVASSTRPCDHDPSAPGVTITVVAKGSPAELAGLLPGDRLLQLNGVDMHTHRDVITSIYALRVGDPVTLAVDRAGQSLSVSAILAERPLALDSQSARNTAATSDLSLSGKAESQHFFLEIMTTQGPSVGPKNRELAIDRFVVSPNPSSGIFQIEANLSSGGLASIVVLDINGRMIFKEDQQVTSTQLRAVVDLTEQPNGTYLLSFSYGGSVQSMKLLKL